MYLSWALGLPVTRSGLFSTVPIVAQFVLKFASGVLSDRLTQFSELAKVRVFNSLLVLKNEKRTNILNFCTYVQWVPNSDVVVAQSEQNLCVWYNRDDPEQVTSVPIAGDIEMVLRDSHITEVIVTEGNAKNAYQLDAKLIEFGTVIEDLDFPRAISFLDHPDRNTRTYWSLKGVTRL
ncbi:hypothetical protein L596_014437 [Steinernema carpocapsae]|uniref:Uncharacterized protein n=1 Tax=Steinernema carpocapsae TaxID=34508 RepID=A0A4U5NCQ3_STECR|nr:hypothetical protein L596_014437 [Steinernema carpocapsae]